MIIDTRTIDIPSDTLFDIIFNY